MTSERLQKLLARAGVASRRKAEDLIREGRVSVNGKVATLGEKADFEVDAIRVDGRRVQPKARHHYLLLNKPRGFVCTRDDPQGRRTVFDLVPPKFKAGLVCAGRLDFDSEGLLLLTDDGNLVQRVTHPRYGCHKVYAVKVRGIPEEAQLDRLRRGIVLDGRRTQPASIELKKMPNRARGEKNCWLSVRLAEGRNRQIREMFHRIGHPVQRLVRTSIADLGDERLPVGALRELTSEEVARLRSASRGSGRGRRSPAASSARGSRGRQGRKGRTSRNGK